MSAYIVSDQTINQLVSAIDHDPHSRSQVFGFGVLPTDELRRDLAQRMADMNAAAIAEHALYHREGR